MNPHDVRHHSVRGVSNIPLVMEFAPKFVPNGRDVLPRLKSDQLGPRVKPSFIAPFETSPATIIQSEHTIRNLP
jgi:hypothetical protein